MPTFILTHRPENPDDRSHNSWSKKQGAYENAEDAVRGLLPHEYIMEHEYVVYKIGKSFHSDEFHHDGTFDDIAEKLE